MPEFQRRRANRRGFSLIMTACGAVVMILMLGLTFDVGRMFITKNELQTFADAAALAAAAELTGSRKGVEAANPLALSGPLGATLPNAVNFESARITDVATAFGTSPTSTFDDYATASVPDPNTYRFVRVTATAATPFYFLPLLPGVAAQHPLSAVAVAGQRESNGFTNGGLAPFSPAAHDVGDTRNFGFVPGEQYTLKWGNNDQSNCSGDRGSFNPGLIPSQHDYVDIGQGVGTDDLRDVILYGGYPNPNSIPSAVVVGTLLNGNPGNRGGTVFHAMSNRSAQDPDQTSLTYAQYITAGAGNNRRIISTAIHDPALNGDSGSNFQVQIVGFGNFLIEPANAIRGAAGMICGTYIGPASTSGAASGATNGTKIYSVVLYQ